MKNTIPYRHRVLVMLFFLIVITYLDRVCISLVGVRIKTEFKLSNEQFGWVLGAFALAYAFFEIPAGRMGDRIGQRKVLIRIVTWWSLFTILTGFTTGFMTLIVIRFLFGMGEAGSFPNSSGVISRWLPASEISRGISSLFIGQGVGAAIAPLIVVPLAIAFGWRAPFFINGGIGIIWILVCYYWFRNEPVEMKRISIDEVNLIQQNRRYIGHAKKFPWKTALRQRNIWAIIFPFFCSQWGLFFFIAWLPVYLQQGRHFSESSMKTTTSVLFVVGIVGSILGGYLSDLLIKRKGLVFGRRTMGFTALFALALSIFIAATTTSNLVVACSLITGNLFLPFFGVSGFSTCIDIGGANAGTVAGIANFFGQIGSFVVSILFGKMVDATHNFNTPLFAISTVLLTGSLVWLLVDPNKQVQEEDEIIQRPIPQPQP